MTKRIMMAVCLMLVVLLCSVPVSYGESIKLTIAHWMFPRDAVYKENFDKIVAGFMELHPNVEIELVVPGTSNASYIQGVTVQYAGGVSPDILAVDTPKMQSFWMNNIVLDITDQVNSSDFNKSMFYPWTWEGSVYNNRIYGIPLQINHRQLFINNEQFETAGVSIPSNDWQWKDFMERARKTTRDTNGDGLPDVYGLSSENILFSPWLLHAWGGSFYSNDGTKVNLLSTESINALTTLIDLEQVDRVSPMPDREKALGGATNMAVNGTAAMILGDITQIPAQRYPWDFTIRLWPTVTQRAVASFTNGFAISNATKHPDLAWEFINYLFSPSVMSTFLKLDYVTARRDVNSRGIFPNSSPEIRNQVMFGINETNINLQGELVVGPFDNFTQYDAEIKTARNGDRSVRQILESLVPILQTNLEEFRVKMNIK
jgi:multiple sugar transport system substrate-binding protein